MIVVSSDSSLRGTACTEFSGKQSPFKALIGVSTEHFDLGSWRYETRLEGIK